MELQKLIDKGEVVKTPIIEKCKLHTKMVTINKEEVLMEQGPCTRTDGEFCNAYINPAVKWRLGNCGLATHIIQDEDTKKFKLNPIKASKRG